MSTYNSGMGYTGMPTFYSPYNMGTDWNTMINGIVQQAVSDALASQQQLQDTKKKNQTGPVRDFFQNLFSRQMPGSVAHTIGLNTGIIPQPVEQPTPTSGPRQTGTGRSRIGKWNPADVQWGNPQLGFYQPPNWSGWNHSSPQLASNPYNPYGNNYGGRPMMNAAPRDDLFKRGGNR